MKQIPVHVFKSSNSGGRESLKSLLSPKWCPRYRGSIPQSTPNIPITLQILSGGDGTAEEGEGAGVGINLFSYFSSSCYTGCPALPHSPLPPPHALPKSRKRNSKSRKRNPKSRKRNSPPPRPGIPPLPAPPRRPPPPPAARRPSRDGAPAGPALLRGPACAPSHQGDRGGWKRAGIARGGEGDGYASRDSRLGVGGGVGAQVR